MKSLAGSVIKPLSPSPSPPLLLLVPLCVLFSFWIGVAAQPPGGGSPPANSCANKCDINGGSADLAFDYDSNADFVLATTNGCPNHMIENAIGDNPNSACAQDTETFYIPKVPVFRDTGSTLPDLETVVSGIMVSLSGGVIFGPATGPNGGDAGQEEADTFDYCQGHADQTGNYHYHLIPYCLEINYPQDSWSTDTKHSPIMAWGPDGFPLYGPYGDNGEIPTDLDACGGHSTDTGANGGYHYHMQGTVKSGPTEDMTSIEGYPYVMECLKGCVPDNQPGKSDYDAVTYSTCVATSTAAPSGSYIAEFTLADVDYKYPGYSSVGVKAIIFYVVLGLLGLCFIYCCCRYYHQSRKNDFYGEDDVVVEVVQVEKKRKKQKKQKKDDKIAEI